MPSLSERRIDAWTALAAEPAVLAAERAMVTGSSTVLADTLAIAASAEARRRLTRILDLKEEAERDVGKREAYQRAADDFRSWAAAVYLAALREPPVGPPRAIRPPSMRHTNPHTEESISVRRLIPRPPFPGQKTRHPYTAKPLGAEPEPSGHATPVRRRKGDEQPAADERDEAAGNDLSRAPAVA